MTWAHLRTHAAAAHDAQSSGDNPLKLTAWVALCRDSFHSSSSDCRVRALATAPARCMRRGDYEVPGLIFRSLMTHHVV